MGRLRAVVLVVLVSVCGARTASADQDPKQMFEAATAEFNLGHYNKAAAMYEEIYKITLQPVLLYNIGQAHRLAGDLDKASFFYKGYLRAQPQAKNHVEVERRIVELDSAIAAKKRTQERPPNVPAAVEARRPKVATTTTEPASQPRPSPPATAPSEQPTPPPPATASEAAPPPTESAAPAATEAQASTETPSSSDKPIWKKWWFWTIIGGVVVVGVVVAVAVVATQAPSFDATLPETGPGAHALRASPSLPVVAPQTMRLLQVQF